MTTTYLYIENMQTDRAADTVKKLFGKAGYTADLFEPGVAKIAERDIPNVELRKIKQILKSAGFELSSICQTFFAARPEGVNIL